MTEQILNKITEKFKDCPFIQGIVLGGSRATGTADENSDIDVGIYYDHGAVDFARMNEISQMLDDDCRENLICEEGGWGNWVNCGGWLVIDGYHVDLILRDISRVKKVIEQSDEGIFTSNYQPGHPHGYIDVMYRGELACAKVLYARDDAFLELKKEAEVYPDKLQEALIEFFMFEAGFSRSFVKKYAGEDVSYVAGHLFRSVSAINQILFALNKKWCLNEKKAVLRIDTFEIKPQNYSRRVKHIFQCLGCDSTELFKSLNALYNEMTELYIKEVSEGRLPHDEPE